MEMALVIEWSRDAIRMALLLGGPPLLVALAVGLLIGIGQTLTQMQEPVVSLIPRMIAVLLIVLLALPWLLGCWTAYTVELISALPAQLFPR
jgi:flagellar biosynthesis protein FliQ